MSERVESGVPEAVENQENSLFWKAARYTGATAIASAWGAVMGAAIRVQFPRNIELSEDITLAASLDIGGAGVRAGEGLAGVQDPELAMNLGPLDIGAQATIRRFDVDPEKPESLAQFASLIANPKPNILEPVQAALMTSVERGALAGGLTMALVSSSILLTRHRMQQKDQEIAREKAAHAQTQTENKNLKTQLGITTDTPSEATLGTSATKRRLLPRAFGRSLSIAAATAVAAGGLVAVKEVNNLPPPATKTARPLDKNLGERANLPETTEVVGTAAALFNEAAELAFKQIELGDRSFRVAGESFDKTIKEFVADNGLDYLADPEIQPILMLSDIHCNAPFIEHILPRLIKSFGIRHIMIAGDTMTTYGKLPTDNGCYDSLLDKLQSTAAELDVEILALESPGNHDTKNAVDVTRTDKDGRKRVRFVRLTKENGYRSDIFGFPVVGSTNPTYSDFEGTKPEGSAAQDEALAEQGERTADAACKAIDEDEYGLPPFVMTHDIKESIAAMLRGCGFFFLSGHEHEDRGVRLYNTPEGKTIMQHTMGSSSGADGGITNITPIKKPATATILKLKPETRSVAGFIKVVLHGNKDEPAEIFAKAPPTEPIDMRTVPLFSEFSETHTDKPARGQRTTTAASSLGNDFPYKGSRHGLANSQIQQGTAQRRDISRQRR